jgi:DNA polymerase-4
MKRSIVHINVIGFRAAVAAAKDKTLRGRPYVIAGAAGGRSLVWDVSPEAKKAAITPGMPLAYAEKRVKGLLVLTPDSQAYTAMNDRIEKTAAYYAPVWQNDRLGNLYLDVSGTAGLWGPALDCASRVMGEILEDTGLIAAGAAACNKLVSKIGTRTIRPAGLIGIREGDEAAFLAHQDIRLLPGMGPKLLNLARITGLRDIGDIAALSDTETLSLFGRRGPALRDSALGIDDSLVEPGDSRERSIKKHLDFSEDGIDLEVIRAGLEYLAENAGFDMRNEKLGTRNIGLYVAYSDGVIELGGQKEKRLLVTDQEITQALIRLYERIVKRRLRIKAIGLQLKGLTPSGYEADLFIPETEGKERRLQEAADRIRGRFGINSLTSGMVLAASKTGAMLALP